MNIDDALSLFDWPSAFGLVVAGLVFGAVAVPLAWPLRMLLHTPYPAMVATSLLVSMGLVCFVFLTVIRLYTQSLLIAERTIGTGLLWVVFAIATGLGLAVRSHAR